MDWLHDRPAILDVERKNGIETSTGNNFGNVHFGRHGRGDFSVAGQPTAADHSPETFFDDQRTRRIGQCVREAVVLVVGTDENVGAVERVAVYWVVVGESAVGRQYIPRIVDMEVGQPEPQREVDARHAGSRNVLGYKLPLRKNGVVFGKFVFCVGRFVRIDLRKSCGSHRSRPASCFECDIQLLEFPLFRP